MAFQFKGTEMSNFNSLGDELQFWDETSSLCYEKVKFPVLVISCELWICNDLYTVPIAKVFIEVYGDKCISYT